MTNEGAESANSAGVGEYFRFNPGALDDIIGRWQKQGDDVRIDADLLTDAFHSLGPSASDAVTTEYFSALSATFDEFHRHTDDMSRYIDDYAVKLAASRQQMTAVEEGNTAKFPHEGSA